MDQPLYPMLSFVSLIERSTNDLSCLKNQLQFDLNDIDNQPCTTVTWRKGHRPWRKHCSQLNHSSYGHCTSPSWWLFSHSFPLKQPWLVEFDPRHPGNPGSDTGETEHCQCLSGAELAAVIVCSIYVFVTLVSIIILCFKKCYKLKDLEDPVQ